MPEKSWKQELYETLKVLCISLLIVIPIRMFIAQPFVVRGASMEPNYHDGEYLVVDEISYHFGDVHRQDVIVLRYPVDPKQFFIKRVIGLPGDTIIIKEGKVFIREAGSQEEKELNEPYLDLSDITHSSKEEYQVKEGQYFVMGDNRLHSSDSRIWGMLDRNYVVGRAFLRLWPASKAGIL